jgi:hypothetical protein
MLMTMRVPIMLIMRMLNYSLLFSYPPDNNSKDEEILPHIHYYSNPSVMLHYM